MPRVIRHRRSSVSFSKVTRGQRPSLGPHCGDDEHSLCPHLWVGGLGKLPLCMCDCHRACRLGGVRRAARAEWHTSCTCPGAPVQRQRRAEIEEESQRRRQVFQSVDIGHGRNPGEIQADLQAAFEQAGIDPKTDFSRASRFLAANTAPRGSRYLRLLAESASALAAAKKWWDENMHKEGDCWVQNTDP